MYSLPMRTTLAAFTMASAASTDPISPLVSTSPRASCGTRSPWNMRETVTHRPRNIAWVQEIAYDPKTAPICVSTRRGLPTHEQPRSATPVPHLPCPRGGRDDYRVQQAERHDATRGDAESHAQPRSGSGGQSARTDVQIRGPERRAFQRG